MTENSASVTRIRDKRDRRATEQAIVNAFEAVLLREGVKGLGVNAVANEAGVNKVLIYRYFDNFAGLAKTWAESSDVWPSALEVIGGDLEAFSKLHVNDRVRLVARNYMQAIRSRPLAIELLAAELCFPSEITAILVENVEKNGKEMNTYINVFEGGPEFAVKALDLIVVVNSLTAFMAIRERNNPNYLGWPLDDNYWDRLHGVVDEMAEKFLAD